jgi:hypothetical protein
MTGAPTSSPRFRGRLVPGRVTVVLQLLVLVAFVGMGALQLPATLRAVRIYPSGPLATSDDWLGVLAIPNPSEAVLAAVADLPPDRPLLVVGSGQEDSTILSSFTFSHLLWPRPVWYIKCVDPPGRPPTQAWLPKSVEPNTVAVLYYFLDAPSTATNVRPIGPRARLVPASQGQPWTSYCPA